MGTPVEPVPRPTHRAWDSGTVDEKAGQDAGHLTGHAHVPALKELAAQVLARAATRDSARDAHRDKPRNNCPTAPEIERAAGQSPLFAADAQWREYFEERAAIREHDGRMSRASAAALALDDCIARWRALNPLSESGDGACVHCGESAPDTPVLARGGHAWTPWECWAPMNAACTEVARTAVMTVIGFPRDFDTRQETSAFRGANRPEEGGWPRSGTEPHGIK